MMKANGSTPYKQSDGLIDRWGRTHRYLRVSLTDRCNLRCRYCIPAGDVRWRPQTEILTPDEILRLLRIFVSLGIAKVRFTGGEPLLRNELLELIRCTAQIAGVRSIGLTTNGVLLAAQAAALRRAGLQSVNISLDTLQRDRFCAITGHDRFDDVVAGIEAALSAGFALVKINVVVMRDCNEDELCDFVEFARMRNVAVRFIEFMPLTGDAPQRHLLVPFKEMKEKIERRYSLTLADHSRLRHSCLGNDGKRHSPAAAVVDSDGVAKMYRIDGWQGAIGFITPMTKRFCDDCNRLRLLADGALKCCLFQPAEVNLCNLIRCGVGDDTLITSIREALLQKQLRHSYGTETKTHRLHAMSATGG